MSFIEDLGRQLDNNTSEWKYSTCSETVEKETIPLKLMDINWSQNIITFQMDSDDITKDRIARFLNRIGLFENLYFDTTLEYKII